MNAFSPWLRVIGVDFDPEGVRDAAHAAVRLARDIHEQEKTA